MGAPSNLADQDHHVIRLTRIEDVLEEMSADLLLSASDWDVPNLLTFRPRRDCKSKNIWFILNSFLTTRPFSIR